MQVFFTFSLKNTHRTNHQFSSKNAIIQVNHGVLSDFICYLLVMMRALALSGLMSFLDADSYSYGSAHHRVVAHTDQTHHLNMCGYG